LRGKNEIREVFSRGRSFGCQGAKLFVLPNGLDDNRVCFALPRKFGNAVERNRARRLCREVYRHIRPRLKGGYDVVVLIYPAGGGGREASRGPEKIQARREQLKILFSKAGLWHHE
jgi:ribonuclease P protein component